MAKVCQKNVNKDLKGTMTLQFRGIQQLRMNQEKQTLREAGALCYFLGKRISWPTDFEFTLW